MIAMYHFFFALPFFAAFATAASFASHSFA
jgi:hypothetical protein